MLNDDIQFAFCKSRHQHLTDVCRTKWIARSNGLDTFIELLPALVPALEFIKDNVDGSWNTDSSSDA